MIILVSDKFVPSVWPFRCDTGDYGYQLKFEVGKRTLESKYLKCPPEAVDRLVPDFAKAVDARDRLDEAYKQYPSELKLMVRCPIGQDGSRCFDAYATTWHPLLRRLEEVYQAFQSAKRELLPRLMALIAQSDRALELSLTSPNNSSNSYAYCRGRLWSSRISLDPEQWLGLVDRALDREKSLLARSVRAPIKHATARVIPPEVRREVWRRDEGRCVVCHSRERLEFDHIIPVIMGGSNTARNLQLLCETCNRGKGGTLG